MMAANNLEVVAILEEAGVDINARNKVILILMQLFLVLTL